ncbi:MAG: glycoside hydrolase family 3 C-terminal domain-containing protein, partial [Proteobacteria bacterium]|nr:glycoside hydrolase family 3 C-terminal domain-containing protein [Pseudomonadota bacterium]
MDDLLGGLSLSDKLGQLTAVTADYLNSADPLPTGIGMVLGYEEGTTRLLEQANLRIPALVVADITQVMGQGLARPLGLAASFDPAMVRKACESIVPQLKRSAHLIRFLGLDITRDARWGRAAQTFGENPYLSGRMAVALVRALRSGGQGFGCLVGPYPGVSAGEGGLHQAPVQMGMRQLREVHLEPYATVIRDAEPAGVYVGSGVVDGDPCIASRALLNDLVRQEFELRALVVADAEAIQALVRRYRVCASLEEACVLALRAGVDLGLPLEGPDWQAIEATVADDKQLMQRVDDAARRVLRCKITAGLLDETKMPEAKMPKAETPELRSASAVSAESAVSEQSEDHLQNIAARSQVLLINDSTLPLTAGQTTHVYGIGKAALTRGLRDLGVDAVEMDDSSSAINPSSATTSIVLIEDADQADRSDLRLPGETFALLEKLAAGSGRVVVVVATERLLSLSEIVPLCSALLLAWLPPDRKAVAIARVLAGVDAPGGKLPVSLPSSAGQVPVYAERRYEGIIEYQDSKLKPLFAFGHGLSYSEVVLSGFTCPDVVETHSWARVSVTVANRSDIPAEEVVQLYVRQIHAATLRPARALAGFARVLVPANYERTVTLQMDMSLLGYFDQNMAMVVTPGEIEIELGTASDNIAFSKRVRVNGERRELAQRQLVATQV